jgi:hypothetical protein
MTAGGAGRQAGERAGQGKARQGEAKVAARGRSRRRVQPKGSRCIEAMRCSGVGAVGILGVSLLRHCRATLAHARKATEAESVSRPK